MKKVIVISALIASSLINFANAEASKQENIGFISGALTGAAAGGPIGFILGGAIGVIIGDELENKDELEQQLNAANHREFQLKQELAMIQENIEFNANQTADTQWMTEGLTLNLMFTTNSAGLSDNDHANIKRLANILGQFPELKLKLDGYTDPRGTKQHNLELSQQRVDAVKTVFESYGVDANRVISAAHGEADGFTLQDNNDAYAMARKVSVNFLIQTASQVAQN